MKIIDFFNNDLKEETVIALGSFDGLHNGHIRLIDSAIKKAKEMNIKSMVYTFENHPLTVVNKAIAPKLIMDNKKKLQLLENMGVDITCLVKFDEDFMKISPEDFFRDLYKRYNVRGMVIGFNYRFGHKNAGDVELLKKLCKEYKVELVIIEPQTTEENIISSSSIRSLIKDGNVEKANMLLIDPFMLRGTIEHGKKVGKKIGYPTANLKLDYNYVIPAIGIYYTNVIYDNKIYKGITSVGNNPTLNGEKLTIETYILDFNKEIYDEEIELYFIEKTREEIKFSSLEELKIQLKKDEDNARAKKIYNINRK
ncbi:bifunctional riboflavin kinase/FAD synthetase [Clostridium algidicarnis]|uniref:Riboflavin biosynthesis protein n=1 Tax=Clostridium algidicarnis DSM 15099 TaxID=1121295 RepID=A0A2S6FYC4_9CLOT|nr:bifunctional riboflavin kinase/FAD synthetase [Clostridium algidicarnis]MBB6630190.1 bifunctional riboflavin kinase/FAD synthetase [Clostridium algidicarnis]MBU3192989.1 bifunctional riboflavin kinase/FAD synthetase [Clostridium algidicarnis]PPK48444.1 riboflavin kinase/FMN adenylyltransferase [Clostridium algidicarnis DSM 15099]